MEPPLFNIKTFDALRILITATVLSSFANVTLASFQGTVLVRAASSKPAEPATAPPSV